MADNHLESCCNNLIKIHSEFYNSIGNTVPFIMYSLRFTILNNVHITFTGVFPNQTSPSRYSLFSSFYKFLKINVEFEQKHL